MFSLLEYDKMLGEEYEYPDWSTALGWVLTLSSILCIPAFMIYKFLNTRGGFRHVRAFSASEVNWIISNDLFPAHPFDVQTRTNFANGYTRPNHLRQWYCGVTQQWTNK